MTKIKIIKNQRHRPKRILLKCTSLAKSNENPRMLFDDWFSFWMEEYKRNSVKVGTFETYRQFYKSLIFPAIGKIPLCKIKSNDIQSLCNRLFESGYAISSLKIVFVLIKSSLKRAVLNGILERNPADSVQLPRNTVPKRRTALTKEQQDLFSKFSKESPLYQFFAVMLRTGLRNGELRGLKFSDIDFKNRIIHVRRTIKYLDGKGFFEDSPKTISSFRDIPITDEVFLLLQNQFSEEFAPEYYVFPGKNKKPLGRDYVQYELNRIIQRINENGYSFERITPHVFRHTFATRAIESGMSPQVLKTILGHSSLSMTMDLYSHVLPDTRALEMAKISSAFL